MNTLSPFHQGELAVQILAQESDIAQRNGTVISNKILPGAIPFIAQQNMLVVSSLDNRADIWVSVLIGKTGFITAPDSTSLLLDTTNILKLQYDPLWENIKTNPKVGVLAIELSTRRRYRINGSIKAIGDSHFSIAVITAKASLSVLSKVPNAASLSFTILSVMLYLITSTSTAAFASP